MRHPRPVVRGTRHMIPDTSLPSQFKETHQAVAVFEQFPLEPAVGNGQRVAPGMAQHKRSLRGQQSRKLNTIEELLGQRIRSVAEILFPVGRVGNHKFKLFIRRRKLRQRSEIYDVTAWSLPLLFNVEAVASATVPEGSFEPAKQPKILVY